MTDVKFEAHKAAVKHLDLCDETMDEPDAVSPLYCGDRDCEVRETLEAAWPIFVAAAVRAVPCVCHPRYTALQREDPDCQHHDLVRELGEVS